MTTRSLLSPPKTFWKKCSGPLAAAFARADPFLDHRLRLLVVLQHPIHRLEELLAAVLEAGPVLRFLLEHAGFGDGAAAFDRVGDAESFEESTHEPLHRRPLLAFLDELLLDLLIGQFLRFLREARRACRSALSLRGAVESSAR